jgi:tRNA U34 5-methylaminomethyl-2-thiouridine-forming methyltransferase MnmC
MVMLPPAIWPRSSSPRPPLVPGLHRFDFDGGGVQLLLALGDVRRLLPELVFSADAFYLDGFSPAQRRDVGAARDQRRWRGARPPVPPPPPGAWPATCAGL